MRAIAGAAALLLCACAAERQGEELPAPTPTQSVEHPPAEPREPIEVTVTRPYRDPEGGPYEDVPESWPRCAVTRTEATTPPSGLDFLGTSPDGANRLFGPKASFMGGDHNVFDEITSIFAPPATRAVIVTADATYTVTAEPGQTFSAHYTTSGEAVCTVLPPF